MRSFDGIKRRPKISCYCPFKGRSMFIVHALLVSKLSKIQKFVLSSLLLISGEIQSDTKPLVCKVKVQLQLFTAWSATPPTVCNVAIDQSLRTSVTQLRMVCSGLNEACEFAFIFYLCLHICSQIQRYWKFKGNSSSHFRGKSPGMGWMNLS